MLPKNSLLTNKIFYACVKFPVDFYKKLVYNLYRNKEERYKKSSEKFLKKVLTDLKKSDILIM